MKSHASDLSEVALCIYRDACAKCAVDPIALDEMRIKSRAEHEGLSFLTITLPAFGKGFEKSLDLGRIDSNAFRSFKKARQIPAFLQGIVSLVFNKETGRILDAPRIEAVEGVRQICLAFKKLEHPCTSHRVRDALREFESIERMFSNAIPEADAEVFLDVSSHVWSSVFGSDDSVPFTTIPKHGPGATAEKLVGNQKYKLVRWHDRLEKYFPMCHNVFHNENACDSKEFRAIRLIHELGEQPVRVIPVPKTLKTPRIIAIEPVCMQYTQQALSEYIVKRIRKSDLTGGHINFDDQTVNQRIALMSSQSGDYATIDLSSASDRVPFSLAVRMFDHNPDLKGAVSACRSRTAQMPDKRVIALRKFASMGSALCFPVEAMYFYTICIVALIRLHNLPVTYSNIRKMGRYVYVYGDDIIVPTYAAATVSEYLQKYHCKVNTDKSFWTGKFRESCGVDAYAGEEVTPTYLRQTRPRNRREAKNLISWVKASNLFYRRGYWKTADHLVRVVESIIGSLPITGPKASGLGKVSFQHLVSAERWNKRFQVVEVKTWCAEPVYQEDKLAGYPALMKCLLALERRQSSQLETSKDHLMKTARHGAVALKRRWIRPY